MHRYYPDPSCLETDEVLWTKFTTAFQNSWKDSSKKQNAHDQLRKLVMKGWDIDTYIVTFERLALSANWALAAEGTIVQFREGLNRMVHSRALDQDKIPKPLTNGKQPLVPKSLERKKNTTWDSSDLANVAITISNDHVTSEVSRTARPSPAPHTNPALRSFTWR